MTHEEYHKAELLLQTKKYHQGINYLKELLKKSPDDPTLHAFLAGNYQGLKRLNEAENAIAQAIKLKPLEVSYYKLAGKIQLLKQSPGLAKKYIQSGLELDPDNPDLLGYQSFTLLAFNKYEEALDFADNGLSIDPANIECLKAKAISLSFLNNNKEAKIIANDLLANHPVNATNLYAGGLVSLISGEESSKDMLSQSLAVQPDNLFIQNAYRLSLRSNLWGFRYVKYWTNGFAQKESAPAKLFAISHIVFLLFCFAKITDVEGILFSKISWIWIYHAYWTLVLFFQLSMSLPFPIYDAWLYLSSKKARPIYTTVLKLKISLEILLILAFLVSFVLSFTARAPTYYSVSLHTGTLFFLVFQVFRQPNKNNLWIVLYPVAGFTFGILSFVNFRGNFHLFLAFNIAFRSFVATYSKVILKIFKIAP